MSSTAEAEGETVDAAVEAALAELAVGREQVDVEVLREPRRGVLGISGQVARVRLTVKAAAVAIDPATGPDAPEVLREILRRMDVPAEVQSGEGSEPGQVLLRVSSESGALLIGRHGQTLDALEYLVNRI